MGQNLLTLLYSIRFGHSYTQSEHYPSVGSNDSTRLALYIPISSYLDS